MGKAAAEFSITASRVLPAKRWQVLRLITRVQTYARYMPNVKECTVLGHTRSQATTSWKVEMGKIPISWQEEEIFDFHNFTIRFRAVDGDLEKFEGSWKLTEHVSGGTEVLIEAAVRLGIPVIENIIGGAVADRVKKNFEAMLQAFDEILTARRYQKIGDRKMRDVSGFAVIGHPYNYQHLLRYLKSFNPDFKPPSQGFLSKVFDLVPSYVSYDIQEFRAASGVTTHGAFIACNIIPDMLAMDLENVVRKVVESCKVAERLGLGIVTLGGFTSIAGERYGDEFYKRVHIPVTTGNTLTAALAVEGVLKAAELMEVDLALAKVTVVGGTGDIGSAVACELARYVKEVTITSRTPSNLRKMEKVIKSVKGAKFRGSHDNNEAVKNADIVVAAAGASQSLVKIENFKPGAIICDVGYPKNIAYRSTDRGDILIFAGGVCESPCPYNAGFDIGMPSPNILYGCFTESIVLALENRYENFSWGKGKITGERMNEILGMAKKHGFKLAPFFWGDRLVTDDEVRGIKTKV